MKKHLTIGKLTLLLVALSFLVLAFTISFFGFSQFYFRMKYINKMERLTGMGEQSQEHSEHFYAADDMFHDTVEQVSDCLGLSPEERKDFLWQPIYVKMPIYKSDEQGNLQEKLVPMLIPRSYLHQIAPIDEDKEGRVKQLYLRVRIDDARPPTHEEVIQSPMNETWVDVLIRADIRNRSSLSDIRARSEIPSEIISNPNISNFETRSPGLFLYYWSRNGESFVFFQRCNVEYGIHQCSSISRYGGLNYEVGHAEYNSDRFSLIKSSTDKLLRCVDFGGVNYD